MLPKKIYLNYVDENDEDKTWSEEPVRVADCDMQNREYTDLSQVWHDANEKPRTKEWLLVQFDEDDYDTLYFVILSIDMWCDWCKTYHVIQWAYISDMLPKGGEK